MTASCLDWETIKSPAEAKSINTVAVSQNRTSLSISDDVLSFPVFSFAISFTDLSGMKSFGSHPLRTVPA